MLDPAKACRYIPLHVIGEHLLRQYHAHPYGDFRATILGLLAAYNYEASILQVRAQLTNALSVILEAVPLEHWTAPDLQLACQHAVQRQLLFDR